MKTKLICMLLVLALLPAMAMAQEPQAQETVNVQIVTTQPPQAEEAQAQEQEAEEAEEEEPMDIAVVYAPRTGKATMRKKASAKADVVRKCNAGIIVNVLERGDKFTKISYKDKEGYMLTSCLEFHSSLEKPLEQGVLSYNQKATGTTTVNVRNKADKGSRKVGVWKTGTQVQVYGYEDGWANIEFDGIRGWVMEEFLTVEEEAEESM